MKTHAFKRRPAAARRSSTIPATDRATRSRPRIQKILRAPRLQTKLTVGAPDDAYEREADRVADAVMRMPEPVEQVQRMCPECEEEMHRKPIEGTDEEEMLRQPLAMDDEEMLSAKSLSGEIPEVDDDQTARIRSLRGGGQPLPEPTRAFFEPRFGADFGNVRVHAGERAAEVAKGVNARAFTLGSDVVFGAGEFAPRTQQGRRLIAHELTHVVQQRGRLIGGELSRAPVVGGNGSEILEPDCQIKKPEACHTYEAWVHKFSNLTAFVARSGHEVIGKKAPEYSATDATSLPSERRPVLLHDSRKYLPGDYFIDGPTEEWVRENLPESLVEVAYQLPTDCADLAVILRHVWLVSHGRSENYRGWYCGSQLRDSRSREIRELINKRVWSGSVERIIRPYTDDNGKVLRSWAGLKPVLKGGDVLIWDHTGRGETGHTHTVVQISGNKLELLQGNQPVSEARAKSIAPGDPHRQEKLRKAPGRRIERSYLSAIDNDGVWTWPTDATTVLIAAGPPVSTYLPSSPGERVAKKAAGLRDWVTPLRTVKTLDELLSMFEAALLDTRSRLETSRNAQDHAAEVFGRVAGERLWHLAKKSAVAHADTAARLSDKDFSSLHARDLGETSHYRPLRHMLRMLLQNGEDSTETSVATIFAQIASALEGEARGYADITFSRKFSAGTRVVSVLVTGFDPFAFRGNKQVIPEHGHINPSGAAILQLDDTVVPVKEGKVAEVEGVILPVSYEYFRSGLIESTLQPHISELDAVITVSLDPNLAPGSLAEPRSDPDALQLERFAVGVYGLNDGRLEAIPGSSKLPTGPAFLEASGAKDIGGAADLSVTELQERRAIEFAFPSSQMARNALSALGLSVQGNEAVVQIDEVPALRAIARTMKRQGDGTVISFRLGEQTFSAQIRRGPGGSFLSNEVSYRVLRYLAWRGRGDATSFHIHAQRGTEAAGGAIPQAISTKKERLTRRNALKLARRVVTRLVVNLRKIIKAVAMRILDS